MRFEFATATQIVFGAGTLAEAGALARRWGRRTLVVTGRTPARAERLRNILSQAGVESTVHSIPAEPTVGEVLAGVAAAREAGAESIIGFGGGSPMDAAKAIAGFLTNPGDPNRFLEVVGQGQPLENPAVPWMAIPTTAGTGSEVTRNAVLSVPERRIKVSLRSPHLLARVALIDPELACSQPPAVTAASGMDAITQLLEAYVCNRANPMSDALAAAGLPLAARALPQACNDGMDSQARSDLALASMWSGQALATAGLGAVHGFANPVGGYFSAPHGAICAALLAPVMSANLAALRTRAQGHAALERYQDVARWLTGQPDATAEDGVAWMRDLVSKLQIPSLGAHGMTSAHVPEIATRAQAASSMKANPIALTPAELASILNAAL